MLTTNNPAYIVTYPQAMDYINQQLRIFWFPEEIKVEKDVQDILTNLTEAEKHGALTTLKLFTQYEMIIGDEYWAKVQDKFKHPACVQRMANLFSFFELNVHAPFYAKINDALGLSNQKFYTDYVDDPVLKARMVSLNRYSEMDNVSIPEFLIMLALTEGAVLYSSFAFLKHFQSQGKNKLSNVVRGINFSARDENLHSEASAWLFRTYLQENNIPPEQYSDVARYMAAEVREHEHQIVDKIFEKGKIDGITDVQMKHFVDSRINLVMKNLGQASLYEVKYNPIAEWFYDGVSGYIANDFFAGVGREYSRDWSESDLAW